MMAAASAPAVSNVIPSLADSTGISVNAAESVKRFSYTDVYGTWELEDLVGQMDIKGNYYNAKFAVTKFTPASSKVKNVNITGSFDVALNILGVDYKVRSGKITRIGERAFNNLKIETVYIPGSVTDIDRYAFIMCTELQKVSFANGAQLKRIKKWCFLQLFKS